MIDYLVSNGPFDCSAETISFEHIFSSQFLEYQIVVKEAVYELLDDILQVFSFGNGLHRPSKNDAFDAQKAAAFAGVSLEFNQ